ncbi:MAG TPA: DUF4124 domain-containing protein [Usitatibacter sp.]|nr:DUF4124 domain-containing protein [Usitatibacter sp.]
MQRVRVALVAAALLAALAAHAQVLYKWTGADGKTQYSDQPPKGFAGVVTRIEPDIPATPAAAAPKAAAAREEKPAEETIVDLAAKRRQTRETLRANVERARARVEAARDALKEAQDVPGNDDRQIIQQRVANRGNTGTAQNVPNRDTPQARTSGGGMHGMSARANCRNAPGADGKVQAVCPTAMLRPEYFERLERLEEALKKAEADLELAQETYRRNVD